MKQPIEHYENRAGGKGTMHIERLLSPEEMGPHVKMYARVTIDVGSSLGYHAHHGDSETYYILEGKARYHDNGTHYFFCKIKTTLCNEKRFSKEKSRFPALLLFLFNSYTCI